MRHISLKRYAASAAAAVAVALGGGAVMATPALATTTYGGVVQPDTGWFVNVPVSGTCTPGNGGPEETLGSSLSLSVREPYLHYQVSTISFVPQLVFDVIGVCGNKSVDGEQAQAAASTYVFGTNTLTVTIDLPQDMVVNYDGGDPSSSYSETMHLATGAGSKVVTYTAVTNKQKKNFTTYKNAYNAATNDNDRMTALNNLILAIEWTTDR